MDTLKMWPQFNRWYDMAQTRSQRFQQNVQINLQHIVEDPVD